MWLLKWHQSKSLGVRVRVPAPVSPLSWQPSGGLGRLMRSRECKQKWVTYKRDLTLADYHNHRTWCPNLRVVVQHWEEFHNRLLILPIESVVLQQKKPTEKQPCGDLDLKFGCFRLPLTARAPEQHKRNRWSFLTGLKCWRSQI